MSYLPCFQETTPTLLPGNDAKVAEGFGDFSRTRFLALFPERQHARVKFLGLPVTACLFVRDTHDIQGCLIVRMIGSVPRLDDSLEPLRLNNRCLVVTRRHEIMYPLENGIRIVPLRQSRHRHSPDREPKREQRAGQSTTLFLGHGHEIVLPFGRRIR